MQSPLSSGKCLFSLLAMLAISGTSASRADVLALVSEADGNLDKLDITTGVHSLIKNSATQYGGLAYNADETTLYGLTFPSLGSLSSLVTINQTTGVNSLVGPNGVALLTITNLADGRLFGVDFNNDSLFLINPSTGATTLVGATGLPVFRGVFDDSLASDGTTLYYTLDIGGGLSSLYTLSSTTGAATLVGSTGVTGIVGSAFAGPTFGTGQLYGFLTNGQTLRSIAPPAPRPR